MIPIQDSVSKNGTAHVVWSLIALNTLVFVYQLMLPRAEEMAFLMQWALVPKRYFDWSWAEANGLDPAFIWPFITNAFLHGGFFHIIFNMWVLWLFGRALEDRLGPKLFLSLYLLSGIAASLAHALFNASSEIPALGASGAIAGLISAYALRFPFSWVTIVQPIFIFPFVFALPTLMFAGLWFSLQIAQGFWSSLQPSIGGGIAWWAHIGGFLAGWLLIGPVDRLVHRQDERRRKQ